VKQNILTVLILLCVILTTVIPLQAAERINVFERKKPSDTSSGDSETSPANKSKVNPEQQKTVDNIAKALQRGTSGTMLSYYYFILLIFFILCLVLFYLLHELYWEQYVVSRENPWNLFRELCSAHKLNKSERQLLRQIAEEQQWENPLQIFIDPLHLKSALDHKRFEKSYSMIEALLIKLFDLDMKDELLIKTQVIEHSTSPLATTIIYRQDEKHKKEHSEIRTTK
jgi:preprotein translocase subunit SecG